MNNNETDTQQESQQDNQLEVHTEVRHEVYQDTDHEAHHVISKEVNKEIVEELDLQDAYFQTVHSGTLATDIVAESDQMPSLLVDEQLVNEIKNIPDRFGFKIGDVADLLGIKQYVLRYWEQEFELLKPKKSSNNHRFYSRKDVENAFLIRKLLYRDKFSIEGARQALKDVKAALKKEKDYNSVIEKFDKKSINMQEQVNSLISDVKRIKELFVN